jgi:DNA-binding response OmpR family regulator
MRVILTAGALEPLDEEEARRVQADSTLRKPFEASVLLETVRLLVEVARQAREAALPLADVAAVPEPEPATVATAPDPELVRAAVTLALDASMPAMIDDITARVVGLLKR